MQIVTVQFNYEGGPDYGLLFDVFKYSCKKFIPEAEFVEYRIEAPEKKKGIPYNFIYNTDKLRIWLDHMESTKQNVIFADCDMLATGNCEKVFDADFDIGFTARTRTTRIPMNGGIVFAKPTQESLDFFKAWVEINDRMLYNDIHGDGSLHARYRRKWAGMNQAAFGWLMEHKDEFKAKLASFKTNKYNAVDCDWSFLTEASEVYFIHYKSRLRKLVLENTRPHHGLEYCKKIWYQIKAEMLGEEYEEKEYPAETPICQPAPLRTYKPRKV